MKRKREGCFVSPGCIVTFPWRTFVSRENAMKCNHRTLAPGWIAMALAAGLCFVVSPPRAHGQDDELAKELPRIAPLEPPAALKSFRVQPGFQLEPIATEPVVTDPVSVCYDADGRLYVVEMRGYPFPEKTPSGNVTLLEDRDGDGRFETRSIFLDGLSWPTGIAPYDGGVFVAVAPDIVYAKDTDGDGVADVKKVMFSGFATDNVQGLLNGLLWGPDGWIYGVASINGGTIENRARPQQKPVSVRGRDFRFKSDGSRFEAISGGGQFGHAFDDWGHRFTCNNSNHVRQIVIPSHYLERNPALLAPSVVLDIAAEGPAAPVFRISPPEPWRVVRTRQRVADPAMKRRLPPTELFATGFFTSATGITIYRGSAYPAAYRGNVFVGDVGGNLIHRKALTVDGATFLATRADAGQEFLASTDNWFRPVNFANTPNGTLLIVDMYRETIEHPFSIPEPIKRHLDLTSGKDRGRLYDLVHTGAKRRPKPALTKAAAPELVRLLADPDAWWRETAQRLLSERQDRSIVPQLQAMVRARPNALGRLHALCTLDVLGSLDEASIVLGLDDPEPRVREQAIRLAESRLGRETDRLAKLASLAGDPDPMVRFQLALTLGEASNDPKAIEALAALAVRDASSHWLRSAVLSSIAGRSMAFFDALAAHGSFLATPGGQSWIDELAFLVGADHKPGQANELLKRLSGSGQTRTPLIRAVLALARGQKRAGGSWTALLKQSSAVPLGELVAEAARLAESSAPADDRLPAIQLVALGDPQKARELLPGLLDARQPAAVQLAVLQAYAGFLDRDSAGKVAARWKSMSPSVRREAAEVLLGRRDGIEAMISEVESDAIAVTEIDPARWKQLEEINDQAMRVRVQKIVARAQSAARDRAQVIAALRPAATMKGDRDRGREVFTKICATCHQAEGRGIDVGPNLATVTSRTPEDLLLHILEPNREVAPNYVNYNVATEDGRVYSGIIAEESAGALVLRRAEGARDVIPRDQIERVASTGVSLMPEGLEKGLSLQDLADLIAFVRSIGK
jgi:putative membrane-bound dehydrogenase-like protein